MTRKRRIALSVLGLILLVIVSGVVAWVLIGLRPKWYRPRQLSREDLLAAEERMFGTVADFTNASQMNEPFILELTDEQINDMLAVRIDRHRILPDYIADPVISLGNGAAWAGAMVTWKGKSSVVSVRIRPFVDSGGLLHIELDRLKAGALGLPENFLPDTLNQLEQSVTAKLTASRSNSEQAKTAKKNKDLMTRVFTALSGTPVPANFVTREDLQMAVEDIRITPGLLEIQFRPMATGD
ncbi:MAG: hypothetical protein KAT11_03120 [Phycisphaerae bacterium]|nr:hypothetical protein [Phycisphaerae bacterium]